jgi:type VI secretion system protein ImpG
MRADEDFLRFYFDELTYLREAGARFAEDHPRIAARLEMPHGETADPHVERLIESFAFLTARLQRQMHAEFPAITTTLLGALYPQLIQPLPPMSIACFDVGSTVRSLTEGFPIRRNTPLFAQIPGGLTCRFRTCYDTTLWPVTVTHAAVEQPGYEQRGLNKSLLHIRLEAREDLLKNPEFLPRLRLFLDGPPELTATLYEMLFANTVDVLLLDKSSSTPVSLGIGALKHVGFAPEESVLPCPPQAMPGYGLLQEYFSFRQKFLFFDVENLSRRACAASSARSSSVLDLLFVLRDSPKQEPALSPRTFRLGCTPIINLFAKTSEPIRLDHYQLEYRLVADYRREATTEIHSISGVSASANPLEPSRTYAPFYSFRYAAAEQTSQAFWHSRRVKADRGDLLGTDIYLSFVDRLFQPAMPADQTVFAHTLCTNRWLASQLPERVALNIEESTPVLQISCLTKPTHPFYPHLDGPPLWRFISALSLHSASLMESTRGLDGLREILRLFCFSEQAWTRQEIEGICEMHTRKVVHRSGSDAWRGFRRGTEVTFLFDPMNFRSSSALLLALVLRHFLGLYCSVNTFTQVVAMRHNVPGEWKRWAPLAGCQEML